MTVDPAPSIDPIVLTVDSGETYLPEALAAYNAAYGDNVTFASLNGGGTKTVYAYDWFNKDNWKVKDGDGNLVDAPTAPQQGDTAIFDKTVSGMMSLFPDSAVAPGLQRVQFNANNTIHQGYVSILAGGDGKTLLLEYYAGTTFILR